MATWTFGEIKDEVRNLTGRFTENELSDSELSLQINRYYQFVFPTEVKLDRKYTEYEVLTTQYQPYYTLDETSYTNFVPPAYIDNKRILWYQDNGNFLKENPLNVSEFTPWTGDDSTVTFTTTFSGVPVFPGTMTITDNVETFRDTGTTYSTSDIILTGDQGGTATINYDTGSVSVTFSTAPTDGTNITVKYVVMPTGQPQSVLMFNNRFQFYPVPDTVYTFSVQAYQIVSALVNATDTPDLQEWGPAIATGTAREIFRKNGEFEAYAQMTQLYQEQINYVLTRTVQDLSNTRAIPNF